MSLSDNQREREVIRLLYDLLLKWDEVLEYTDRTISSIADRHQIPSLQQRRNARISNNNDETQHSNQIQRNNSPKEENLSAIPTTPTTPITSSTSKKKVKTKKKSKTNSNKKRKSYANDLEENLSKLDDIIEFYSNLKKRALRTIISHGKTSNAAKDVNQEIKEEIDKYLNLSRD